MAAPPRARASGGNAAGAHASHEAWDEDDAPQARHTVGEVTRGALTSVILALALTSFGCEALVSDSATRIAYAVRDGAARLRGSKSETLVLSVAWQAGPDGCPDGYPVEWRGGRR